MNHTEDDLLPISGLSHLSYCERRAALIHIEQVWAENQFTAEGRVLHEKAHESGTEAHGEMRVAYSVRLCSWALGLSGIADVVEFHRVTTEDSTDGVVLKGRKGLWRPYPVEYKRGKPKTKDCDEVQLSAQAMCLKEMLKTTISCGALFYGKTRRRKEVVFDAPLRQRTAELAFRLHTLICAGKTPHARYEPKCDQCSLLEACRPQSVASGRSARRYLERVLRESLTNLGEKGMDEDA
jgi:CRISPR-associated exonuclease Cas4